MDRKSRFSLWSLWNANSTETPAPRKLQAKFEALEGRHLLSVSPWSVAQDDALTPAMISETLADYGVEIPASVLESHTADTGEKWESLHVTSALDGISEGEYVMTLREAIQHSQRMDGPKAIIFDASLSGKTIVLEEDLLFTDDITIDVSALQDGITLDMNGQKITIAAGARVNFNCVNFVSSEAYLVMEGDSWALITNHGDLVLTNCSFEDILVLMTEAQKNGLVNPGQDAALLSIIANEGTLTMQNVTFAGNSPELANVRGSGTVYEIATANAENAAAGASNAAAQATAAGDYASSGAWADEPVFSAAPVSAPVSVDAEEEETLPFSSTTQTGESAAMAEMSADNGLSQTRAAAVNAVIEGIFLAETAAEATLAVTITGAPEDGAAAVSTSRKSGFDRCAWVYAPAIDINSRKQEKNEEDALAEIKSLARMVAQSISGHHAAQAEPPKDKPAVPDSAFTSWQLWAHGDPLWQHARDENTHDEALFAETGRLLTHAEAEAETVTAANALPAPTDVQALRTDTGEVEITWQSVPGATHYLVETSTDGGASWSSDDVLCHDQDHSAILRRLASETEYLVRVTAVGDDGASADEPSEAVQFVTGLQLASPALTNIHTADAQTVTMEISDTENLPMNVNGYAVEYATDPGVGACWARENITLNARTVTITGLEEGVVYFARLKAIGIPGVSADSEWEPTEGFFTVTPLDAPMNVDACVLDAETIRISWEPVANTSEYLLEYAENAGPQWTSVRVSHDSGATAQHTLTALRAEADYHIRITALGSESYLNSQPSFTITASTCVEENNHSV